MLRHTSDKDAGRRHVSGGWDKTVGADAQKRSGGCRSKITGKDRVKPPRLDWSMHWTTFHCQFKAMAGNKNWRAWQKTTYLLAVMQGSAIDVMHSGHTEVAYKDIVKVLEGCYREHQLAMEYCS
jgi:hypothetical protein